MKNLTIIFLAEYLHWIAVGVTILFGLCSEYSRKKQILTLTVLAAPFALVIDKILNKIIISPRPFVEGNFTPLVYHIPDNGFPSEHTLLVMVLAGIIWVFNRKLGAVLIGMGFLVGMGRILAGVHSPIDIFGSTIIALAAVATSYYTVRHKQLV